MPRLLKLDPRPPAYDSIAEASLQAETPAKFEDMAFEHRVWRPLSPPPPPSQPRVGFVDGVQRLEMRLSAEGEGWPIPGALASYAAGAVCPGEDEPLCHVAVERAVILARGAQPSPVTVQAQNGCLVFAPQHCGDDDFEGIGRAINDLRGNLEAAVIRALLDRGLDLVVVDGRLPEVRQGPAVGFIKTIHDLYVSEPEQVECLTNLKRGERSPVFRIRRARGTYYSWFVCLADPEPWGLSLSGFARLELDDSTPREQALRLADLTAACLPPYASARYQDSRAPQNLLPVGQLERELRHRLGDPELLQRLLFQTFATEAPDWTL